jgi:ABC-2 type transport system ATP-binding protein
VTLGPGLPLAVDAVALRRAFGRVQAVGGVDLQVPVGVAFGLIGPNGAGKTTTLRLLATLIRPDSGSVALFGQPAARGARTVQRLGVSIERPAFYPYLSGRENLRIVATLRGADARAGAVDAALERVGLTLASKRTAGGYSAGMRQRLAIAEALVGSPDLVILDEPTASLDPSGIVEVRDLVNGLVADGVTVLLSSHQLGEVERICRWVAFMVGGVVKRQGQVDDLAGGAVLDITFATASDRERAATLLQASGIDVVRVDEMRLQLTGANADEVGPSLGRHAIYPTSLITQRRTLESLYLEVTDGQGSTEVPDGG